ncbi:uncharacterized protein LOC134452960 [Engraulis encrasicolus]|uniref:uncharacterized protein LOC134452960 n=1 Tax=Engraulis encrasicolus TaxID=184585 RepID=UPI002FD6A79D
MRLRGLNPSKWICEKRPHAIQKDGTSCGAYVLKFAKCVLEGLPLQFNTSPTDINKLREEIVLSLILNTDDLQDLCHSCGEQTGDTQWIGCDRCLRWFHQTCVQYTVGQEDYICAACQ